MTRVNKTKRYVELKLHVNTQKGKIMHNKIRKHGLVV